MILYERRPIQYVEGRSDTFQYLLDILQILSDVDEAISNHIAKEGHGFFSISNEYQTISNQYQNRYRSVLLDCG